MLELTEDELEVAEVSIAFALQNCPVEGVLTSPDGTPVTYDGLQALLERLKEMENRPGSGPQIDDEILNQVRAVIDYTSENCPVENVSTFHDGRPILGTNITALAEKLRAQASERRGRSRAVQAQVRPPRAPCSLARALCESGGLAADPAVCGGDS